MTKQTTPGEHSAGQNDAYETCAAEGRNQWPILLAILDKLRMKVVTKAAIRPVNKYILFEYI